MSESGELTGQRIGEYRLESLLGCGGMADVYAARDAEGLLVAIKILRERSSAGIEARFEREIEILVSLEHPNLVVLHGFGSTESGRRYFVMEHLLGQTLEARLSGDRLREPDWRAVLQQVALGLSAAHARGVVHRDLKPANIFLTDPLLGPGSVKVLDFGIAKLVGSASETETFELVGTPRYMSPEQARGQAISVRTDVFSLGAIAYEIICGVRPFGGETTPDVVNEVLHGNPPPLRERSACSESVSRAVAVALNKEPKARWRSVGHFVRALEKDTDRVVRESDAAPTVRAEPTKSRDWQLRRVLLAAMVVVGLIAIAWVAAARAIARHPLAVTQPDRTDPADEDDLLATAVDDAEGTLALARAYASGDRRLAVRIALRHRLQGAEALQASIVTPRPALSAAISSAAGELVLVFGNEAVRYRLSGELIAVISGEYSAASYSPGGEYIALDGPTSVIVDRGSGETLWAASGVAPEWLDATRFATLRLSARGASVVVESIGSERSAKRDCPDQGRAFMAVSGERIALACRDRFFLFSAELKSIFSRRLAEAPRGVFLGGDGESVLVTLVNGETHLFSKGGPAAGEPFSATAIEFIRGATPAQIATRAGDDTFVGHADFGRGLPTVRSFSGRRPVAFTRDHAVVAESSGRLLVLDWNGGLELLRISAHAEPVRALVSEGDVIVSLGLGTAMVWHFSPRRLRSRSYLVDLSGEDPRRAANRDVRVLSNGSFIGRVAGDALLFDTDRVSTRSLGRGEIVTAADGSAYSVDGHIFATVGGERLAVIEGRRVLRIASGGLAIAVDNPSAILRYDGSIYQPLISNDTQAFTSVDIARDGLHYLVDTREGLTGRISIRQVEDGGEVASRVTRSAPHIRFFGNSDIFVDIGSSGAVLWNWKLDKTRAVSSDRIDWLKDDLYAIKEGGRQNLRRFSDGGLVASLAGCHDAPVAAGSIVTTICGQGFDFFEIEGGRVFLSVPTIEAPTLTKLEVALSADASFAVIAGAFGFTRIDLEAEDRPGPEVVSLAARLAAETLAQELTSP